MAKQPEELGERPTASPRKAVRTLDIQAMKPFEAGQLITAPDLNRLVEALKALDRRLAALERR